MSKMTEEHRRKISESLRGRKECRRKLSEVRKTKVGWHHTSETKEKMRVARLKNNHRVGTKWTDTQRAKLNPTRLGSNNGRYSGGREVECSYCQKRTYRIPCAFKARKNFFCSQECYWDSKRDPFRIRKYPRSFNRDLKRRIKARDGWKCSDCGGVKSLLVHHKDQNKSNCVDDNLITMCQSCHVKWHNSHRLIGDRKW